MIISDTVNHKIDVEYNKEHFLHLTAFHLKEGQWTAKTIGLSPKVQLELAKVIQGHHFEEEEI